MPKIKSKSIKPSIVKPILLTPPKPKFTVQWTTRMGICHSQAVGNWTEAIEWLRGFGDRSQEGVSTILVTFIEDKEDK